MLWAEQGPGRTQPRRITTAIHPFRDGGPPDPSYAGTVCDENAADKRRSIMAQEHRNESKVTEQHGPTELSEHELDHVVGGGDGGPGGPTDGTGAR